ncbi:MAG: twin-arginine translocase subunit TatB [Proteobacteria bacterium]|nr:MAG: twin-arginine translocase subunit TatB [Pseudomonadota bacterium]
MFDIGFWEMSLIALIALIVLGPERLPGVARTVGHWIGRARRMIGEVKADIDREIRNAEIKEMESLKKDIEDTGREVSSAVSGASETAAKAKDEFDLTEAIQGSAESMKQTAESSRDKEEHAKKQ